jgi:non-ribosomal peptide synthase protein (TIGR01720 family)
MKKLGYQVEIKDLFENPTIAELAPLVKQAHLIADQSVISGVSPLTPIQQRFFMENPIDLHHFNQAVLLHSEEKLSKEMVGAIFTKIQEHHDVLRTTFKRTNGNIEQETRGLEFPLSLETFDFCGQANGVELLERKTNQIQASINLENGPLMKLGLFYLDHGTRLLVVFHHLVIDGVSWRIIFEDIAALYQQYKNNEPLELPLKTSSYKSWAEKLCDYANSEKLLQEKNYWGEIEATAIPGIKRDFDNDKVYVKDSRRLSFHLSEENTALLLTKVNEAFGTEINDILITSLGLAVREIFGLDQLLISMEGHGREQIIADIDIGRTVGWFTSIYPVLLVFSYGDDISRQIKEVKETINKVPNNGIGYGILKYLTKKENKQDIHFKLKPQVIFNYLGQFDEDVEQMTGFSIAKESPGNPVSLNRKNEHDLCIHGMIANKKLEISIIYSDKMYKPGTLQALMDSYKTQLNQIISFCAQKKEKELTPSDFDFKHLSIEELENFFD